MIDDYLKEAEDLSRSLLIMVTNPDLTSFVEWKDAMFRIVMCVMDAVEKAKEAKR